MTLRSLRLRLLIGGAIAVFTALAVAWAVMMLLFERHIERRVEDELRRAANQLLAGLVVDPEGSIALLSEPVDPRFDSPASGLYWQVSSASESRRSRSLWDAALPAAPDARGNRWTTRNIAGPFQQNIFVVERLIRPDGARGDILIQIAHDEKSILQAAQEFGRELALFLVLLWLVLSGAAFMQVQLGLRPLTHLRHDLRTLKRNPAARLGNSYPQEVAPLTAAINDLADAREADLKRARQRAADLAHGLKTPLAALSAQTRLIKAGGSDGTEGLERAIAAAAAAVEGELARARAAASRTTLQATESSPLDVSKRLITVLERTEKGMRLDFDLDLPADLRLLVAPEDLYEILGPLLENAVRFARRAVRISGHDRGDGPCLIIEDDGPGIAADRAADALTRGTRLDESAPGSHGLGLAIARDLVEATDGSLRLSRSDLGGLRIDLCW